jgi:PhnB protein
LKIIGESVLFFADGTEEGIECDNDCDTDEQERPKKHQESDPSNIHIHVYVNDAAEVVERAEKAGGTSVMPILDDESGQMGGFVDPFNNLWWVKSINQ